MSIVTTLTRATLILRIYWISSARSWSDTGSGLG